MAVTQQTNMELKREQVEALIQQGQKRGLKGKDIIDGLVRRGYQPEGVDVGAIKATFVTPESVETKTNAFERVSTNLKQKGSEVADIVNDPNKSAVEKGVGATAKAFSGISSTAYNILPETARNALDKLGGGIGKGFQYLTDKISDSKFLQEAMSGDPENTKNLESALQIASDLGLISGEVLGAQQASNALTKGVNYAKQGVSALDNAVVTGTEKAVTSAEGLLPKSPEIMNKVARLKPTDATKFEKLAGKTHGQYLTETGNFGTPDKIIAKEAQKFTQSINSVDDALAKLPGVYKDGSIADALTELTKKAVAESGDNIKAPYASRLQELSTKFAKEGLDMSEINEVKRLFEKNVKLGYNKLTNAEKVAQSTNIDSALRKWQVEQATKLGFKNISDLNKQTQLSKFIIDKLGDQVVGQTGLNGVTLTDWIMLSGGDPTAVAGFLTKKFFSSKSVQSKIAEMLNKGDIKGQITADVASTPESIKRAVSPQGFEQLNAPKLGAPLKSVGSGETIRVAPKGKNIEMTSKKGIIPSKQDTPQQLKRLLEKPSSKSITTPKKVKGVIPETNLINEAKKYKSAEEFVKAQGTPIYHGSNEKIKIFSNKKGTQGVIWFTDNPKAITAGESGAQGTKFINERITTGKKFAGWDEYEKLGLGQIQDMGFDGVKLPTKMQDGTAYNDYILFDNKTIKTKSQLEEIWKKAVGKK